MFNTFKGVLEDKKLTQEGLKKINIYLFKRWASGNIDGLMCSSLINSYDLNADVLYEYYRCVLSSKKIKYIPWVKEEKELENIEFLSNHFKVSKEVARDYYDLLDEEKIQKLKDSYGGR